MGCLSEGGAGDALLRGEEQPGSIAAAGEAAQQVAADLAAATAAAAPAADAQPGADVAAQQPSADMPPAEVGQIANENGLDESLSFTLWAKWHH